MDRLKDLWKKLAGSRKAQIALVVLSFIILGCISLTAATAVILFFMLFAIFSALYGLTAHRSRVKNVSRRSMAAIIGISLFFTGFILTAATATPQTTTEQPQAPPAQEQKASTEDSKEGSDSRQDTAAAAQSGPEAQNLETLTVRFVDVGQGDGSIIEFPDGKTMVIDAGRDSASAAAMNAALSADGREQIDWLVATHPDADHIGGLPDVISANVVNSVWAPNCNHDTETYTRFLQAVANTGLSIDAASKGKTITTGANYKAEILWPPSDASFDDTNDYSVVIKVTYGNASFLFTGDATLSDLAQAGCGHADVLKVAHHGSNTGTSSALLARISPKIAVISYGLDNSYGHPTRKVLDALSASGAIVYGTGAQGTITVTTDGTTIHAAPSHDGTVVAGAKPEEKREEESAGAGTQDAASGGQSRQDEQLASPEQQDQDQASENASQLSNVRHVYVTPNGKKYHKRGCRTLSKSTEMIELTLSEAIAEGYTACKVCGG